MSRRGGFSWRRLRAVARMEWKQTLRRPMVWVLIVVLGLMLFGLSRGNVTISTGDSSVGGDKAWVNSEFNLAFLTAIVGFMLYTFFVAIAAGMSVLRDDETKVSELLHSTALRPSEYIWGKFLGVLSVFGFVMLLHLVFSIFTFQILPVERADEIRGPFVFGNYLLPLLEFTLPLVLFMAAMCFAVGERTRKPILVFLFPVAVFLACIFFLWNWSPNWLDQRVNQLLMVLDPTAFRWLSETWLDVDRGVEIYNTTSLGLDGVFWANRLLILLLSVAALTGSVRHCARAIGGDLPETRLQRLLSRRSAKKKKRAEAKAAATTPLDVAAPLSALGMSQARPGLFRGIRQVLRAELRELRNQPGLYLFAPLILLQVWGTSVLALGAFDTPLLNTPGLLALRSFNTLTLLIGFLLLFYTVESLEREKSTGFDSILNATPLSNASMLFGKSLANAFVGLVVVAGAFLGAVITLLVQGTVGLEIWPFFVSWGLLLFPTFVFWSAFCSMLHALTRDRYATYAFALAALAGSGYLQLRGHMTWVWNWNLWNATRWSDFGTFELNSQQLFLNRLLVLGAAVLFLTIAVRFYGRRDLDAARVLHRFRPKPLVRGALRLLPFAIVPIVLGVMLGMQVRDGFQSENEENAAKDYWRKNFATYRDWKIPSVEHIDVDLRLEPSERSFEASGRYRFHNHRDKELRELLITPGRHFEDLEFTIDGEAAEPEDRSGLRVFRLDPPLPPDGRIELGFSHRGRFPDGATRNGGGTGVFILPSSVVLHTFGTSFLPIPGYIEGIGVDEDNSFESRDYPDDFWEEELEPAFGLATPFTTRVKIDVPEDFTANSVGIIEDEQVADGRRVVTWVSDHPVRLLNVVAGKWAVKEGDGTKLFYLAKHDYNVDEMSAALDAARKYYSEWFYPYPWQELKVSEFAAHADYAQGFPTNITFSEGIGFLTDSTPESAAAFMVTAHEAAHQWWGNILTPGNGPSGNILSEGMSHYSTLLLHEQELGLRHRIGFARTIEDRYGLQRRADSERALVKIDGSRAGDGTVTYDKGGWVMWMLHNLMGREQALLGLQEFIRTYKDGPDFPVMHDLVETLRPFAADAEAYQAFVDQWFFDVVVPEYRLRDERVTEANGSWTLEVTVENVGTGKMPVQIAAESGERWSDDEASSETNDAYRALRQTVELGAGESATLTFGLDFEPKRVTVDPDALVLQLRRTAAQLRL